MFKKADMDIISMTMMVGAFPLFNCLFVCLFGCVCVCVFVFKKADMDIIQ